MLDLLTLFMALNQTPQVPGKDPRGTEWTQQDDKYKIPRENWSVYETPEVGQVCAANDGQPYQPFQTQYHGCVERTTNFDGSVPYLKMWVPPDAPQWLIDHEARHGDGWLHKRK